VVAAVGLVAAVLGLLGLGATVDDVDAVPADPVGGAETVPPPRIAANNTTATTMAIPATATMPGRRDMR
jgi:hypothetical protein